MKLHLAVLWRFKWLLGVGFVLAATLAVLSFAAISFEHGYPTMKYRDPELWVSHETLLVTQSGFPIGQSVYNEVVPLRTDNGAVTDAGTDRSYVPRFADNGRFTSLAVLYARLVNSDPVERLLIARGPVPGGVSLSASAVWDTQIGPLPLVQVTGMGTSPEAAAVMAHNAADSLRTYIARQQQANSVPEQSRVLLKTVKRAGALAGIEDGLAGTSLAQGHSKLKPIFVFAAIMALIIAIAYVLENLRPQMRIVSDPSNREVTRQRSAA